VIEAPNKKPLGRKAKGLLLLLAGWRSGESGAGLSQLVPCQSIQGGSASAPSGGACSSSAQSLKQVNRLGPGNFASSQCRL